MEINLILKVFLLSTLISILIKFSGLYINLNPSGILAICIVITPTIILGVVLWRRFLKSES